MESPIAVANYFIQKSLEAGVSVTPMKLVKLVYIAHGWHLGLTGNSLLNEEAQAWQYGPVLASVYSEFKEFGSKRIDRLATPSSFLGFSRSPSLPKASMNEFLDNIWEGYCYLTGVELSILTHKDNTPWDKTWNHQGGKDKKGAVISNEDIKMHYKTLASNNLKAGIQETLPLLTEEFNNVYMNLQEQWLEKEAYFEGVKRADVIRYGRRLLAILDSFNPSQVYAKLTYDKTLYTRAELGDGSTLQVEVLFGLDEDDHFNTVVSHYMGGKEITTLQCDFEEVSRRLEEIMLLEE